MMRLNLYFNSTSTRWLWTWFKIKVSASTRNATSRKYKCFNYFHYEGSFSLCERNMTKIVNLYFLCANNYNKNPVYTVFFGFPLKQHLEALKNLDWLRGLKKSTLRCHLSSKLSVWLHSGELDNAELIQTLIYLKNKWGVKNCLTLSL